MKQILLTLSMGLLATSAFAQGAITEAMLKQFRESQSMSVADRALSNAIQANSIDLIAVNHKNQAKLNTYFNVETKSQSIENQKSSGRCWMFSGLNVLRSDFALKTDSLKVEYSQAYLTFYDLLEKSNLFLEGIIETANKPIEDVRVRFFFRSPIGDGGTFCGIADLTEKYGLVPKDVMPETFSAESTSRMRQLLGSKLREYGLKLRKMVADGKKNKEISAEKTSMLGEIYHMLTMLYGEPPTEFTYAFTDKKGKPLPAKQYTPMSFYKETVGESLNGTFIMAMNDPRREYYKTYEVEYDRHTYDGHNWKYINLPMEDIEQMAIAALKDGHKMYSSYDVNKLLDKTRGYADTENFDYASLFGTTFPMNKAERISTFDSGSTHAMTLTAVDIDADGKPLKWKVENSWGATWGENKGCLIMSARWFREYMFRLVVPNKYVPAKILKANQQKPILIEPEDPLFAEDE
ncbi:MAG: C1 family peptidase [Prevotellaceae bacterium]|nr:C1 family peptidase [Prevotellaceae bacterium]